MARRPGIHITRRFPAPSGEHPNKYVGEISVDMRIFWPPEATLAQVIGALADTCNELFEDTVQKIDSATPEPKADGGTPKPEDSDSRPE